MTEAVLHHIERIKLPAWRVRALSLHWWPQSARGCQAHGHWIAERARGRLPGRLFSNWTSAAPWVCLTGSYKSHTA